MVESLGSDFPTIERSLMSGITERYGADWQKVKASVTPSSMTQVRPVATP
jgi:hypothetical protein